MSNRFVFWTVAALGVLIAYEYLWKSGDAEISSNIAALGADEAVNAGFGAVETEEGE